MRVYALQVFPQSAFNALVAILLVHACVAAAQPTAAATVSVSSAGGTQANANTTGDAFAIAMGTVNGETKTVGATSGPGGNSTVYVDIDAARGPPVEVPETSDTSTAVPVESPPAPGMSDSQLDNMRTQVCDMWL